jgi:putative flavoprotein involved in K+ transport
VAFADTQCHEVKEGIDRFIDANGIDAPPAEPDPNEPEMPDLEGSDELTALDLEEAGVGAIIWCCGFTGDFSYLPAEALDDGVPRHTDGIGDLPGLYYVGFPWLSKRKSGILLGIGEDATRVVGHLLEG